MSSPLQVKISRDGKEIGTYDSAEAVRLFVYGTLKETDHYWHEGMTDWAPLAQLQEAEALRLSAETARKAQEEKARKAEQLEQEKARAKEKEDRAVAEAVRIRLEEEKAKAKVEEDAISTAARDLKIKKMASERLDEFGGCFKGVGIPVFLIGGLVLLIALRGDDDGSAVRQQVRTQQMTNGILLMILGYIITKR